MDSNESFDQIFQDTYFEGRTLEDVLTHEGINYWFMIEWILYRNYNNYMSFTKSGFDGRLGNNKRLISGLYLLSYPLDLLVKPIAKLLYHRSPLDPRSDQGKDLLVFHDNNWNEETKQDRFFHNLVIMDDTRFISICPTYGNLIRHRRIVGQRVSSYAIPYYESNFFWEPGLYKKKMGFIRYSRKAFKTIRGSARFRASFGDRQDVYQSVLGDIEFFLSVLLPFLFEFIYKLDRLLTIVKPHTLVITNENSWWERATIFTANRKDVVTVALQHGIIYPTDRSLHYSASDIEAHSQLFPKYFMVFGEYFKDLLSRKGSFDERNIIVTGQPRFDDYQGIHQGTEGEYVAAFTFSELSKNETSLLKQYLSDLSKDRDTIRIWIKPHPSDPLPLINDFTSDFIDDEKISVVDKKANISSLLGRGRVLITKQSTVIIEAVLCGMDVQFFDPMHDSIIDPKLKRLLSESMTSNMERRNDDQEGYNTPIIIGNGGKNVLSFLEGL